MKKKIEGFCVDEQNKMADDFFFFYVKFHVNMNLII